MFRNLSFRNKLTLVLLPPLAALAAFATLVVTPRLDERSRAAQNEAEARVAEASMQLVDEFQNERDRSYRLVSNPAFGSPDDVANQRAITDDRIANFVNLAAGESSDGDEQAVRIAAAIETVQTVGVLRTEVDSGQVNPEDTYRGYTDGVDALVSVIETLSVSASNVDLVRAGSSIASVTRGKEQVAQARGRVAVLLDEARFIPSDYALVNALATSAEDYFEAFLESASDSNRAAFVAQAELPRSVAAVQQLSALLAAGFAGAQPTLTGDEWFEAWDGRMEDLDVVEDALFVEFVATTNQIQEDEQRSAYIYVAASALAALAAAAAALLLARSLTRRLAGLSHQAQTIATERLPEVLDALRNPSPDALAGALPQVTSDSTDEIGIMADSFNAVLRTSVETSIGHAQRRAQTMTNILVNLGRRNQALIERQLRLIDELEAKQRDPELLDGLFQLDHMITSMRRNAENLLVLASEQPGRAWTAPVPVLDVVRSASAEVQDMSRISVEVAPRDNVEIAGRFAVDLSHLLAELVDNAISYSPPTTLVSMRTEGGPNNLRIWIIDGGVGMPVEDIRAANDRIINPPDIDELTADQIGFQVVGRLARRLGVGVQLQANPGGGLAASVTVPASLLNPGPVLGDKSEPARLPPSVARPTARPAMERHAPETAASAEPLRGEAVIVASATGQPIRVATVATPPENRQSAAPRAPAEVAPAAPAPRHSEPIVAASAAPITVRAELGAAWHEPATTMAGLAKRVPGQAYSGEASAEAFDSGQFRRLPTPGASIKGADDVAERRQDALSRFQRAVDRGRSGESAPEPDTSAEDPRTVPPTAPLDWFDASAPVATPPSAPPVLGSPPAAPVDWLESPAPAPQARPVHERPVPTSPVAEPDVWSLPVPTSADGPDPYWHDQPPTRTADHVWPELSPVEEVRPSAPPAGPPGPAAAASASPAETDPFDISWITNER